MAKRPRKNVGVIGLGIIGRAVTLNLRKAGFHVFVWNRTPRPVPNFVGSPAELAEMCDYIQIFVSDDDALLATAQRLTATLTPNHVVMAHSTVSPDSMRAAAEIVERRGARFVEAPFTGSKAAADKGELVYYVGGDEVAIERSLPVLEASSREVVVIGQVGQATTIKIATNIVTSASVQAAAEALALVHHSGLSLEKFAIALKNNPSYSTTLAMKLPKMLIGKFEPHFSVKHMLKDMQIANRMGQIHHLDLGVTAASRDRLLEETNRGDGDEDFSAVARKYLANLYSREEPDMDLFTSERRIEPAAEIAVAAEANSSASSGNSHEVVTPREEHTRARESFEELIPPIEPIIAEPAEPVVAGISQRDEPNAKRENNVRPSFLSRLLRRTSDY